MKKKYLLFGDSGSGKSSFVKCLGGKDLDGVDPEVGGKGDSVTSEPKIYFVDDEILGQIYFIDTKGTHDPSEWNNDTIIENLVKALSDLSVLGMKEDLQANQSLDGVLFVSSDTHRFYRTNNLTQLSTRLGVDFDILNQSTITLQTKYNMLQGDAQQEVEEMLIQKHDNDKNLYSLWDSIKPVPYQKKLLAARLANLAPIQLVDLEQSNQKILELARQLQQQDRVFKTVSRIRNKTTTHQENIEQLTTVEEKIVLTPDIPTFGIVGNILSYISDKHVKVQEEHPYIYIKFPKSARQPKVIKGYQIQYTEQNAELIKHSIEIKGDYVEAHFQYKYKKVNNGNTSRIDIKLDFDIKYYELREYQINEKEEYQEEVLLPKYDDEKPYIQEAQKQLLKQILAQYSQPQQQIE